MATPTTYQLVRDLSLTEKTIFNLLKEFVAEDCPDTTLYVAGGWVRDNILKLHSDDIDIAISNMSGEEFANKLVAWMKANKKPGLRGGVSVVKANPDQSKHLATATVELFERKIDFANLRKESYAESRIPTIEPGTPLEDAQRRDLTINALFYNIHTDEIEDYVGGFEDLKNYRAKTPIDAVKTFTDDPLRILRIIRFSSKYDLKIDSDIIKAAQHKDIQKGLDIKVSKERVWKEMAGQKDEYGDWKPGFFGINPKTSYDIILKMDLFSVLEMDEGRYSPNVDDKLDSKEKVISTLSCLFWKTSQFPEFCNKFGIPKEISKRVQAILDNNLNQKDDVSFRKAIVGLGQNLHMAFYRPPELLKKAQEQIKLMGGTKVRLPINGNEIMEAGVPKGEKVGKAMKLLTEEWFHDPAMSREKAFNIVNDYINHM